MRNALALVLVGLVGLFGAASIGYAAYVVSRDTVGAPVTNVKLSPNELAPTRTTSTATEPAPPPPPPTTTDSDDDDESGRGRGRGRGGGGNSGKGGGGDDDD
jgi:uncharacterized membrane protein YgcG